MCAVALQDTGELIGGIDIILVLKPIDYMEFGCVHVLSKKL